MKNNDNLNNLKTVDEMVTSYTYWLEPKIGKLYAQMIRDDISLDDMKRNVRNYVWNANYSWTSENGQKHFTKKKWFLETLNSLETKKDVYFLCRNSINKAKETFAAQAVREHVD